MRALRLCGVAAILGGVALNGRTMAQYLRWGEIFVHWSYVLTGLLLVLMGMQLLLLGFLVRTVRQLTERWHRMASRAGR